MTPAPRTLEQMQEMREMAKETIANRVAFNLANEHLYKMHYLDAGYWQTLALKYKIRMPIHNEPATEKGIRKYLKRTKVSNTTWTEHYGTVAEWVARNSRWTLYGAVGTMMELK
jgi:hypothetical protein